MAFPKEVGFGTDDKGKPLVLDAKKSLAQLIFNMFMLDPGTYPSQPEKGIGIRRWIYKTEDEMNLDELKRLIFSNCSDLINHLELDDVRVTFVEHQGQGILLIMIPLKIDDEALLIGFNGNDKNEIQYRFQVESMKLNTQ